MFDYYTNVSSTSCVRKLTRTIQILLCKIVELYLTVRGYSYSSNLVEKCKQSTSKGTKRTKAFSREIHDNDSNFYSNM